MKIKPTGAKVLFETKESKDTWDKISPPWLTAAAEEVCAVGARKG